jgi:hypothetical protein
MDTNGWTENWSEVISGGAKKCVTLAFLEASGGITPQAMYHYRNHGAF